MFDKELDKRFPAPCRDEFCIPTFKSMGVLLGDNDENREVAYLCGNSLGLMPRRCPDVINQELEAWQNRAVVAHFDRGDGKTPWVHIDTPLLADLQKVVGAQDGEVAVMNSLTTNLNALLVAFYKPTPHCHKIIYEENAFSSDYYALHNQCLLHGVDPGTALVPLRPQPGEHCLKTTDILATIESVKDELALVLLPGIQYYTGQLFEIDCITKFVHTTCPRTTRIGWDLAHAVGNVPLYLHKWKVDFAVWCSYKYLNAGPGAIGGIFIHNCVTEETPTIPRLAGWWGVPEQSRFNMLHTYDPIPNAMGFRQSNPSVLDVVSLKTSLDIFSKFENMESLRQRSVALTDYLYKLLFSSEYYLHEKSSFAHHCGYTIITPAASKERGAQLSILLHAKDNTEQILQDIQHHMHTNGVIIDTRRPNVIRIAPAPLYNTFQDVFFCVQTLNNFLRKLHCK